MSELPPHLDLRSVAMSELPQHLLALLEALPTSEQRIAVSRDDPRRAWQHVLEHAPRRYDFAGLSGEPGAVRWQVEARDPRKPRTVGGYLGWDHRRMEAILRLGVMLAERADWSAAQALLADHGAALRRHADLEDEILFPAVLAAQGGVDGGPIELLRTEHVEVRRSIHVMLRAVRDRDLTAVREACELLERGALEHHAKEEEILFPAIDESFEPRELERLVERLIVG
ncbi:MAG: hemerythrin domain-containing protein [Planctomycetes bacterium]|nr:hemerythrin domain-containing protein [Planctomycetota bacterium]